MTEEETEFRKVLGAELQLRREDHGMTRPSMARRISRLIHTTLSPRTLESVETGLREISVYRLWIMCRVLGVDPCDVLADVMDTMGVAPTDAIPVDLPALRATRGRTLAPLRTWAARVAPDADVLHLPHTALPPLAVLCGLPVPELRAALLTVTPSDDHRGPGAG